LETDCTSLNTPYSTVIVAFLRAVVVPKPDRQIRLYFLQPGLG